MAAALLKMAVDSEDSSSDEEALKRCQEAVWETRSDKKKDGDSSVQQSKRVVVADHEHDGNELQVTQGFRAHVAKKLGLLLDGSITELQTGQTLAFEESAKCDDDDDDEGWRLFSTSVPSSQTAEEAPTIARRQPVPSSSDSDSEMETRLREAAVSVTDLLPASSLQSALPQKKKVSEGEDSHVVKKKKKKKRKPNLEEGEQVDSADSSLDTQRNGEQGNTEQEQTQVKVKRKKKKKREEVLN